MARSKLGTCARRAKGKKGAAFRSAVKKCMRAGKKRRSRRSRR